MNKYFIGINIFNRLSTEVRRIDELCCTAKNKFNWEKTVKCVSLKSHTLLNGEYMADQIKAGDVVQLKSGGPAMTVSAVEYGEVYVDWFEKNQNKTGRFKVLQVEIYEGPPGPIFG